MSVCGFEISSFKHFASYGRVRDVRTGGQESLMQPRRGTRHNNNSGARLTRALLVDIVQRRLLIWEQQIHFEVCFTVQTGRRCRRRVDGEACRPLPSTNDREIKDSSSFFLHTTTFVISLTRRIRRRFTENKTRMRVIAA